MKNKSNKGRHANKQKSFSFAFLLNVAVILIIVFTATVYFVTIRAKSEILNKEAQKLRADIKELETEIKHLKMKKEQLSDWRYVSRKIKRYRLALSYPEPYQVRSLYKFYKRKSRLKEKDTAIALNQ